MSKAIISVVVTPTQIGKGQRRRDVIALRLDLLPGWLFGINSARVKAELKDKIIRYQEECFKVLWRAFQGEATSFTEYNPPVVEREPNPVLVQIREQALAQARRSEALARMADQQIEIEAKALEAIDQAYYAHQRLDEFGRFVNRFDMRLGEVERAVSPGATISTQQVATISQTVKALAEFLTSKVGPTDKAGRVHYQTIFAEIYRRFGASDYKTIRREQYDTVLNFLEDWRISSGGEPQPRQTDMGLDE